MSELTKEQQAEVRRVRSLLEGGHGDQGVEVLISLLEGASQPLENALLRGLGTSVDGFLHLPEQWPLNAVFQILAERPDLSSGVRKLLIDEPTSPESLVDLFQNLHSVWFDGYQVSSIPTIPSWTQCVHIREAAVTTLELGHISDIEILRCPHLNTVVIEECHKLVIRDCGVLQSLNVGKARSVCITGCSPSLAIKGTPYP